MKWEHVTKLEWLNARRSCLTATDIKDLLPVTKTGRVRHIDKFDYIKVLARKITLVDPEDCKSSGAMARGHMLEPYAIEYFNDKYGIKNGCVLHHWDDAVIAKNMNMSGFLGFSPDAMDVEQKTDDVILRGDVVKPKYIGEVKSYSADRHMICGNTPKGELEERWQIAAAMATCESIERAYLIFFHPRCTCQEYVVIYDRKDLEKEIEICLDIESDYRSFLEDFTKSAPENTELASYGADLESRIIEDIEKKNKLNPKVGGAM